MTVCMYTDGHMTWALPVAENANIIVSRPILVDCLLWSAQVRRTLERLKGQLRERIGHTRPRLRLTRAEMSFLPLCLCCWASVLLCPCCNTGVIPPKSNCCIFLLRRDWPSSWLKYMYQELQCAFRKCRFCPTSRVCWHCAKSSECTAYMFSLMRCNLGARCDL